MLLSLPVSQREAVTTLVSVNLHSILCEHLAQLKSGGEGLPAGERGEWFSPACVSSAEGGVTQVDQLKLSKVGTLIQYLESLLENFPPGEAGLRLQAPLGMYVCMCVCKFVCIEKAIKKTSYC